MSYYAPDTWVVIFMNSDDPITEFLVAGLEDILVVIPGGSTLVSQK